jgi:aryl-alcohol dehydrogenase-like predicted oxidoreductase
MRTRKLGSLEVSIVGLGCNSFGTRIDGTQTANVVAACLEAGVTFFDTADIYGSGLSEEYLGRALGNRRDEAVIASKFGHDFTGNPSGGGASAKWVERAVEGSLKRIGTDHIDLYQLNTPDADTPIAETLGALDELVAAGKVREIGCSNFSAAQIEESRAVSAAGGRPGWVSVQNQYSLLHREPEAGVLEACRSHGLGFLPYFPLHVGLLTGKYRSGEALPEGSRLSWYSEDGLGRFYNDEVLGVVERLERFCEGRGRTILEFAFSWLLAHDPVSSVIAGATKPEQVHANAAAASWDMTSQELAEVDGLLAGANQERA